MVIETIILYYIVLVDHSFKVAWEVQSGDRWKGGYYLVAPLEEQ